MLRNTGTAFDLHHASSEGLIRGFARPYIGFTGSEVAHFVGGQLAKGGIRLLDMLQPGG